MSSITASDEGKHELETPGELYFKLESPLLTVVAAVSSPPPLEYEKSINSSHILQERTLGVWSGIFLIGKSHSPTLTASPLTPTVNKIIGAGIFSTPGTIYRNAGSVGLALFVWVISGIIATCGAFVLLELGTGIPRSGGLKNYLEKAYSPKLAATCIYAFCECGLFCHSQS